MDHPGAMLRLISHELDRATRLPNGKRQRVAFRPNAFSDLAWERIAPWILALPYVDPYDYSKRLDRSPIGRYRLIASVTEHDTGDDIRRKLDRYPAAIVVDGPKHSFPATIGGYPVHDGDIDDYSNALQSAGTIIALAAKGSPRSRAFMTRRGFSRPVDGWAELLG